MNFMIYPLGCIAFWAYGFGIGWGNWAHAPGCDGWYASLGPGISVLDTGKGIGPGMKKDDKGADTTDPDGSYKYGIIGTKGFFLQGV